jgi:putative endonuclease
VYFVYILRSEKDGKRYIGMTSNIERRLSEHNTGRVKSTKNRQPLVLVKLEQYETKVEAEKREKFLKTGSGRNWMKENGI